MWCLEALGMSPLIPLTSRQWFLSCLHPLPFVQQLVALLVSFHATYIMLNSFFDHGIFISLLYCCMPHPPHFLKEFFGSCHVSSEHLTRPSPCQVPCKSHVKCHLLDVLAALYQVTPIPRCYTPMPFVSCFQCLTILAWSLTSAEYYIMLSPCVQHNPWCMYRQLCVPSPLFAHILTIILPLCVKSSSQPLTFWFMHVNLVNSFHRT